MRVAFAAADVAVLALYALVLAALTVARFRARGSDDVTGYLAAGRAVTLPGFVMNLVASWYGGILGVSEYSYRHGIASWIVFGVPYYAAAIGFALWIAPRARRSLALTIPEQLRAAYGGRVALLGALLVFGMTLPGAYVLMAGKIVAEMLPVSVLAAAAGIVLLSSSYLVFGGMRAVVAVDRVYVVLMYGGFALLVATLASRFGGIEFLRARLDPALFEWTGGQPVQSVLVWYVIALATLVEPTFYEACFAARDARTAQRGILISVLFWALFDCMTTATGLYARALLPQLDDPARAFGLLAGQVLPPVALGLFFVGLLATVMSTVDSYLFISAQTLGHDVLARLRRARAHDNRWTRAGLAVAGAASVAIAASGVSIVEVWHHVGSVGTPALLVPLVASFGRARMSPRAAGLAMLGSGALAALWLAGRRNGLYWWGIEPIFPALAFALAVWAASTRLGRTRASGPGASPSGPATPGAASE